MTLHLHVILLNLYFVFQVIVRCLKWPLENFIYCGLPVSFLTGHLIGMSSTSNDEEDYEPPSAQPRDGPYDVADDASVASGHIAAELNVTKSQTSSQNSTDHGSVRADSDPPDPERPNKFHGNPSTWRVFTAVDRDIAASLRQLQAQDLSAHLYNAYALKVRARDIRQRVGCQSTLSGDDGDDVKPWQPSRLWTAWPMSAKRVPRETRGKWANASDEGETFHNLEPHDSSRKSLEDIIAAVTTEEARLRFLERESEAKSDGADETALSQTRRELDGAKSLRRLQKDMSNYVSQTLESKSSATTTPTNALRVLLRSGMEIGTNGEITTNSDPSMRPVPLVNDEYATRILQPSVRHLLSRLDQLLEGLHQARRTYYRAKEPSSDDQTSGNDLRSISRSRRHVQSKQSTMRRERQTSTSRSSAHSSTGADSTEDSVGFDFNRLHKRRRIPASRSSSSSIDSRVGRRHKPPIQHQERASQRDWSDVLGLAAIQGWPPEVIERATARCSALFQERMDFTNLDLDRGAMEPDTKMEETDTASEDAMEGGVHVDGYLRPIKRRKGWRGKNKEKGNWRSRAKEEEEEKVRKLNAQANRKATRKKKANTGTDIDG